MGKRRADEEIMRHRNHLHAAVNVPCSCARTGHGEQCRIGATLRQAIEDFGKEAS